MLIMRKRLAGLRHYTVLYTFSFHLLAASGEMTLLFLFADPVTHTHAHQCIHEGKAKFGLPYPDWVGVLFSVLAGIDTRCLHISNFLPHRLIKLGRVRGWVLHGISGTKFTALILRHLMALCAVGARRTPVNTVVHLYTFKLTINNRLFQVESNMFFAARCAVCWVVCDVTGHVSMCRFRF